MHSMFHGNKSKSAILGDFDDCCGKEYNLQGEFYFISLKFKNIKFALKKKSLFFLKCIWYNEPTKSEIFL